MLILKRGIKKLERKVDDYMLITYFPCDRTITLPAVRR